MPLLTVRLPLANVKTLDTVLKAKSVLTHALVDGNGNILSVTTTGAGQNEREQVEELLDGVDVNTGRWG